MATFQNTVTITTNSSGTVWAAWASGTNTCTSITSNTTIWHAWTSANATTVIQPPQMTEEQQRQLQEQQRQFAEQQAREEKERAQAKARARQLLLTTLSAAQRDTYERLNYFDVEIEGKTYRVHQGTHGNVRLLDGTKEVTRFCIQPSGVPVEDAMLAQKLLLESNEREFLRIANATPVR